MKKLKTIALLLALIFTLQVPAYAGTFNFTVPSGYTPTTQTDDASIIADANSFINAYYDLSGTYFEPVTDIKASHQTDVHLQCQPDYNVADTPEDVGGFSNPILYYKKPGGGPGPNQQYLGQTKNGYTITNVRFPLKYGWDFLEELQWAKVGDEYAKDWWYGEKHNSLPEKLFFNTRANDDPNYAAMLDFCIGAATLQQLRHWNGLQYYISKAMAGKDGKPGILGSPVNFRPELATEFPWHKYVNILQPPTYNTWGYGIGFYKHNGDYTYKSFPIAPLRTALVPDLYPLPEGATKWTESFKTCALTYTGKAGEVINVPISANNSGSEAITNIAATWYGSSNGQDPRSQGWDKPLWMQDKIALNKGESKSFTIPVTVPNPGQETRLAIMVNTNGKTPVNEFNKTNNMMIIKVAPEDVDLAVSLKPTKTTYTINQGNSVSPSAMLKVIRKDGGTTPINATVTWTGPAGKESMPIIATPGYNDSVHISFTTTKAGTYTITGEAWPTGVSDLTPADNKASCTIRVVVKAMPAKEDPDTETRVNLRG